MDEQRYAERKIRVAVSKAGSKTMEVRAFGSVTLAGPGLKEPVVIKDVPWVIICTEAEEPGELRTAVIEIQAAFENAGLDTTLRVLRERVKSFLGSVLFTLVWVLLGFALHDPVRGLLNYVFRAY